MSKKRVALDATRYWNYEALGKLRQLKEAGGKVEGAYEERMVRTYFVIDKAALSDAAARTEGYKLAITKIISYMAPGAVADTASNRKYLAQLTEKLKVITGMNLNGYQEWKQWFDANGPHLRWSNGDNKLVVAKNVG